MDGHLSYRQGNGESGPQSRQAWKKTRARSRRLRVMIRNSISSLAHNDVVFLQDEDQQVVQDEAMELGEQSEYENDERKGSSVDVASCRNIDEAMAALHTLPEELGGVLQTWKDAPQTTPEYDWILDGDPEWAAEFEKNQMEIEKGEKLQQSLLNLELEDPMSDFNRLDFDMSGRQENRFANFDDDFIIQTKAETEDDEEEFGEFVSATHGDDGVNGSQQVEEETSSLERIPPSETKPGHDKSLSKDETASEIEPSTNSETDIPKHICIAAAATEKTAAPPEHDYSKRDTEETISVYKMLTLADVSSPESRFTRRRQLSTRQFADGTKHVRHREEKEWWCKSEQEMEEDLPSEYYNESFDGTLELLMDLPWEHVAFWQEEITDEIDTIVVDEHVTKKLSQLDAAQTHVKARLIGQIQQREDMLVEGNQLLHDMDHNLAMAHMYVHRGKDSLNKAQGSKEDFSGVLGMNTLLEDADRRDQLRLLKCVLDQCSRILETEASLKRRIASFGADSTIIDTSLAWQEYRKVIEVAKQLRTDVDHDDILSRLVCLDQLRERACTVMESFRSRIDAALTSFMGRCCHFQDGFSSSEYESLIRAMFEVHEHQVEEQTSLTEERESDHFLMDPAKSWSQCILKSLCYEVDKCLARALLDPTLCDGESAESDYDQELLHLSFELNNGSGDSAKLKTLMHNLVTIRFQFEPDRNQLASVYHKLCVLLADVLHTHYLVAQWHKAPFDPRNEDMAFLHRIRPEGIPEEKKTDECHAHSLPVSNDGLTSTQDDSKPGINAVSTPMHFSLERAEHLERMALELGSIRVPLWQHCESVLVTCLDQYLQFSPKRFFFQSGDEDTHDEEKAWFDDLERLHDIFRLTQQFLVLGKEFAGPMSVTELASIGGQESDLGEKLGDVFRRHLRVVHVEAMNSTGAMLFHESWKLVPLDFRRKVEANISSVDRPDSDGSAPAMHDQEVEAKKCVMTLLETYAPCRGLEQRCWENWIFKNGSCFVEYLPNFNNWGNPFLCTPLVNAGPSSAVAPQNIILSTGHGSKREVEEQTTEPEGISGVEDGKELYSMVVSLLGEDCESYPPIATFSALNGLAKWTWRLLTIRKMLPIILEDITVVFTNIFDLYFTTVFRLCTGCALHEKIVLGLEVQPPQEQSNGENGFMTDFTSPAHRRNSSSSNIFGRRRRSSKTCPEPMPTVSQRVEAEICAPLLCENKRISELSDFLRRGQSSLEGIVNLDKIDKWMSDPVVESTMDLEEDVVSTIAGTLERREGAAWSCLFVASLLDAALIYAEDETMQSSNHELAVLSCEQTHERELPSVLSHLATYVKSVVHNMPTLATLASRAACSRAVLAKSVVHDIVSVERWVESQLHVDSNDYVHELIDRKTSTWLFLSTSTQALPTQVLDKTWEHLVSAAYLAILDGFSRICRYRPNFSAEGIALMSMDVAAFESGMSEIGPSSAIRTADSRHRVSQWITALYLPDTDLMQWIISNYGHYQLNHMLALIASQAKNEEKTNIEDMVQQVKRLYDSEDIDGTKPPPTVRRYHSC